MGLRAAAIVSGVAALRYRASLPADDFDLEPGEPVSS